MDINKLIAEVLLEYAQRICQRVRDKWETSMLPGISGKKEISVSELRMLNGRVVVEIAAQGQAAWQIEFGRGSKMAKITKENPYLSQYFHEMDLWNKRRTGYSIRGREKGTYEDIDGKEHKSSGKLAGNPSKSWGLNLEKMLYEEKGDDRFAPSFPQSVIQEEVAATLYEISEAIADKISKHAGDFMSVKISTNLHL